MKTARTFRVQAYEAFRKNSRPLLAVSFAFIIVVIAAIVLNAVLVGTAFLTVPIVVLPLLFCTQIAFSRIQQEGTLNLKEFHHFFVLGFSGKFRRGYRALGSFFKALLVFFIAVFILGIAASYIAPYFDPTFAALSEEFLLLASQSAFNTEDMMAFLEQHYEDFLPTVNVVAITALGFSSLYFFGEISSHMMAIHFALTSPGDGRFVALTHHLVVSENKAEIRKLFLGSAWPGIVLYLVGFALGSVFAWFFFSNYWMIANFGMIIGMFFVWPYWPVLLSLEEQMHRHFASRYAYHMTMQFKNMVNDLAAYKDLNPDEKEEIAELRKQASDLEKKLAEDEQKEHDENNRNDPTNPPNSQK